MAFEIKDFFHGYTKRGDEKGLFNISLSDETSDAVRYYLYQNEDGTYIIQRTTTSGSLTVKVYGYYAARNPSNINTDWTGRASLNYVEYYQLF